MKERLRLYTEVLSDHLQRHCQMALVGVRPLEAKPGKIIVAVHAAIPSSWKIPRMLVRMVW